MYQQGEDVFSIHYELFDWVEGQHKDSIDKTWNDIFLSISTLLLKPVSEEGIKDTLQEALLPPGARIDSSDFQTILIQLMALKLIMTDVAKDYGVYTYWVLTPYGRSEMVKLKAIKR